LKTEGAWLCGRASGFCSSTTTPTSPGCIAACFEWPVSTTQHAADGWSALRAIHDERPDVLVVDIHVPGLRGDELLTELSSHPETRHIPAIVVTGTDINLAVAQVKQILRKPCAPERLVSVVERFAEAA
jgi:CheY-like chemotaxis protein